MNRHDTPQQQPDVLRQDARCETAQVTYHTNGDIEVHPASAGTARRGVRLAMAGDQHSAAMQGRVTLHDDGAVHFVARRRRPELQPETLYTTPNGSLKRRRYGTANGGRLVVTLSLPLSLPRGEAARQVSLQAEMMADAIETMED